MRHQKAGNNFKRHPSHRRAMLRNIVINLVEHGRIRTTIQKAKAARTLAEQLITLGKKGTLHHRRQAIEALGSTVAAKAAIRVIFGTLSQRFSSRNGGYTRILKLPATIRQAESDLPRGRGIKRSKFYGSRLGDNARLVLFELCEPEIGKREKSRKRGRRVLAKKTEQAVAPQAAPQAPASEAPPQA